MEEKLDTSELLKLYKSLKQLIEEYPEVKKYNTNDLVTFLAYKMCDTLKDGDVIILN